MRIRITPESDSEETRSPGVHFIVGCIDQKDLQLQKPLIVLSSYRLFSNIDRQSIFECAIEDMLFEQKATSAVPQVSLHLALIETMIADAATTPIRMSHLARTISMDNEYCPE
jgi:hypothetical protein